MSLITNMSLSQYMAYVDSDVKSMSEKKLLSKLRTSFKALNNKTRYKYYWDTKSSTSLDHFIYFCYSIDRLYYESDCNNTEEMMYRTLMNYWIGLTYGKISDQAIITLYLIIINYREKSHKFSRSLIIGDILSTNFLKNQLSIEGLEQLEDILKKTNRKNKNSRKLEKRFIRKDLEEKESKDTSKLQDIDVDTDDGRDDYYKLMGYK